MTTLAGMPNVNRGMKAPPVAELLADSSPATPSIAPLPNLSGCFEMLFSMAYVSGLQKDAQSGHGDSSKKWKSG
jgi:hypothetical protein